jgi:hypothetical protein
VESDAEWRDKAALNGPLMRLAFPGCTLEHAWQWKDWKRSGMTFVFERAMVVNRNSAHKSYVYSFFFGSSEFFPSFSLFSLLPSPSSLLLAHSLPPYPLIYIIACDTKTDDIDTDADYSFCCIYRPLSWIWPKMMSSTMNLTVPTHYWEPIRGTLTRSLFGYVPQVRSDGRPLLPPSPFNNGDGAISTANGNGNGGKRKALKPIVTYISRQTAGRRLIPEDHEALVKALRELEEEGLCEVRIPVMERLSLKEQIAEVASSTVS